MVEVVQAEGAGEGIHELDVAGGGRDYVCEVQGEEKGLPDYGFVVDVPYFDLVFISLRF